MEPTVFEAALSVFMKTAQGVLESHYSKTNLSTPTLSMERGRKYIRVSRGGSVYCFVDMTNGDILKAATWKAPAKHARGNILVEGYESWLGPYGPAYLK